MQETEIRIRAAYERLTKLLIRKKLTVTTMESATAGQIASLITDTEGSSAVLRGAFVTYCNEAKIMQGVPAEVIEKYTVYSEETAAAMAEACRAAYQADLGIGVTGTMGNTDPANPEASEPGEVYFALSMKSGTRTYHISLPPKENRLAYKLAVAGEVADKVFEVLDGN
ncbi:MAG: CinA family protein [Lachnospiraceae bacterium]|nr:CinA family protein [Lachnospiraceae bacterium]